MYCYMYYFIMIYMFIVFSKIMNYFPFILTKNRSMDRILEAWRGLYSEVEKSCNGVCALLRFSEKCS